MRCASAQTNWQCRNWCHPRARCTETKKGKAEQVALPERSQLAYELMLADVTRKKALHVKCSSDWIPGHWLQFQLFADMDTIRKEAQNVTSLDGTKKSNMKFREHDLWGRVEWMLLTFTQKNNCERIAHGRDRSVTPGPPGHGYHKILKMFPQGPWFPKGSWGLEHLSTVWQWRANSCCSCGGRLMVVSDKLCWEQETKPVDVASELHQNKPKQDPKQNQPSDPEQK